MKEKYEAGIAFIMGSFIICTYFQGDQVNLMMRCVRHVPRRKENRNGRKNLISHPIAEFFIRAVESWIYLTLVKEKIEKVSLKVRRKGQEYMSKIKINIRNIVRIMVRKGKVACENSVP
jgi:hypothetical protein